MILGYLSKPQVGSSTSSQAMQDIPGRSWECDMCNVCEAGYVEYDGLPGRIKTGCMNTPGYKSRYVILLS